MPPALACSGVSICASRLQTAHGVTNKNRIYGSPWGTTHRHSSYEALATKSVVDIDNDTTVQTTDSGTPAPDAERHDVLPREEDRSAARHNVQDECYANPHTSLTQARFLTQALKRGRERKLPGPDAKALPKSWKRLSTVLLLRKLVVNHGSSDWHSWVRTVAKLQSDRLSVIVLQLMIRDNMLPRPVRDPTSLPLHDADSWQKLLTRLGDRGYTIEKLESYAYILSANSNAKRIERFLEGDDFKPLFVFCFLLHCGVNSTEQLADLIKYCRHWYTQKRPGPRSWHFGVPLLSTDFKDKGHALRLLIKACYMLDPRLLPNVALMVGSMLKGQAEGDEPNNPVLHLRQSRIYNQALNAFRQSEYGVHPQRKIASAYTWAALEILLNTSASLQRPCTTSLTGFRAIKETMASQARDQKDLRIVPRQAQSWPPYILPGDGMDEGAEPEENWSRTVLASAFMQANGYSKEETDLALDVLQGMAPNGSPTVHQNETIPRIGGMRLWEASIMATRDSVEAWQIFQVCPGNPDAKPTMHEYIAMFQKLLYRTVQPGEKALPGDKNLNFPSTSYKNYTELERLRLQPPTVEELYARLKSDGLTASLKCVRLLVSYASSVKEATGYILDGNLPNYAKRMCLDWNKWPSESLKSKLVSKAAVQLFPTFSMTLMRVTRPTAGRIRQIVERAVDILQSVGPQGPRHMAGLWPYAFQILGMERSEFKDDPQEHLAALLHTARMVEDAGQMSLAPFLRMADSLRTFAAIHVERLLKDCSQPPTALLGLYDPETRDTLHASQYSDTLKAMGAGEMDRVLRKDFGSALVLATSILKRNWTRLVEVEAQNRALLGDDPVAPIERFANRHDPIQAEQVHSLVAALLQLGDFRTAAEVLEWAVVQWTEPDLVEALRYLDDDPGFHETLCLFRKYAEPMLPAATVWQLRALITSDGSPFRWPSAEDVERHFSVGAREDEALDSILEHVRRHRGSPSQEGEATSIDNMTDPSPTGALDAKHFEDPGLADVKERRFSRSWRPAGAL